MCSAKIIVVPKTVIKESVTYRNVELDLSNGQFTVINGATLTIANSIIHGTISPNNPLLIQIIKGNLVIKNSVFDISVDGIASNPNNLSIYSVIHVKDGLVSISDNTFTIDKAYAVCLFTTKSVNTDNIDITNNVVTNFHGGILLSNSHNAHVNKNKFYNVSNSNIFIINGTNVRVEDNELLYPGNNNVGDGIDILNSDNVVLSKNYIAHGSCYSVVVLMSKNIVIDRNKILGGITYGILIATNLGYGDQHQRHLLQLIGKNDINSKLSNQNISVTNNYLSQNRFGLAANTVDGLIVRNNIFIQYFLNRQNRLFWTNNDTLLLYVKNLIWENNLYKEAYSQESDGNNNLTNRFYIFPLHGGVDLNVK